MSAAAAAAAEDPGQSGHVIQMAPAQGVATGSVAHVGQPPLEPEDPDQHSRLHNQPASATSVTCKRRCTSVRSTSFFFLFFFFNKKKMGLCLCSRQHSRQWHGLHSVLRLPQQPAKRPLPVPPRTHYYGNAAGLYIGAFTPGWTVYVQYRSCETRWSTSALEVGLRDLKKKKDLFPSMELQDNGINPFECCTILKNVANFPL